ncbi:energy-coupling factor transporter ATPase [Nitrospira sp. M1]
MNGGSSDWRTCGWVSDLTSVWRDTTLIVLTAQIAAIYAAILIPFKVGIPIIPGFVELRPANAIPLVTSLLFGPAAAWGAGIGNLIGDCFGTLGPASVFGFLGNFFLGWIPYVMWGNLGPLSSGKPPYVKSWKQGFELTMVCAISSAVCAVTIAWGVELLGFLPFMVLAPAIFLNNIVMGLLLGPPLLLFLYPRVKRWGLYYQDMCDVRMKIQDSSISLGKTACLEKLHPRSTRDGLMVEMEAVTFCYRSAEGAALRNLSLQIRKGEWIVIMGRRDSGKSTLCHCLNGLIPRLVPGVFSGFLAIGGQSGAHASQPENVGLVFQDFDTQLISTNVEQEIIHPLEYRDPPLSFEAMRERIDAVMREVGLENFASRDPLTLSGGQRQRLVLASVLVCSPTLLVLDQPMTDLDPKARQRLRSLCLKLKEQGMTIILVEHESSEVLAADRLYVLNHGEICWEGTPRELFQSPGLPGQFGLASSPLAECFVDLRLPTLPLTVEDAWYVTDKLGITLDTGSHVATHEDGMDEGRVPSSQSHSLIHFDDVTFGYTQGVPVLTGVSLTIAQGDFVAVLGENGSGKSTLGKLVKGLLLPSEGHVVVHGHNTTVTSIIELSRMVGYVFQNPDHQIFAETVWDEVAFSLKNLGIPNNECEQRVVEALMAVGLDVSRYRFEDPFSLTKGERQRVAVASILAMKPDILIFDEPTTGLDAQETDRMMRMIRALHQQGHTIVMITHTIQLVADYATRCVLMHDGTVLADASTRDIFSDPLLMQEAALDVPAVTRFSQRWGCTLLTVEEVRAALRLP